MSKEERKGIITFQGNPLTLIGAELKVGEKAPDFKVVAGDLSEASLADSKGKTRIISVVPSLDTPVCEVQTKRFNEEAAKLPATVEVITVSMDLPFAQGRFCTTQKTDKVKCLSDHRDASFGEAYGVLIKELRLLSRRKIFFRYSLRRISKSASVDWISELLKSSSFAFKYSSSASSKNPCSS